jgi:thiol-disulfide isomerase/thioredoxin
LLLLLVPLGCGSPPTVRDLSADGWQELIASRETPTIVYAWASWSRESVALLPTILELEQEYEGRGVEFLYVSLDVDDPLDARTIMGELNGPPFYRIAASLEEAAAALGIAEPPAMIGFRRGAAQSTIEGDSLSPEDAEALVEALVANHL